MKEEKENEMPLKINYKTVLQFVGLKYGFRLNLLFGKKYGFK
jgi:hypothetical protein